MARGIACTEGVLPAALLCGEVEGDLGRVVERQLLGWDALLHGLDESTGGVGVLERELLLPPGADNHQLAAFLEQIAGPLGDRAEVERRRDEHRITALRRDQRRGAVGRRKKQGLAADGFRRHFARRVAKGEPLDLQHPPLAGEDNAVALEIRGQPDRFFGAGGGNDGFGARCERRDDRARRSEDINDDDRSAVQVPRIEAEWCVVNVDLHA